MWLLVRTVVLSGQKQFVEATENDFWNDLTGDQKQELKQGMKELDNGQKYDYEEVMSKHGK